MKPNWLVFALENFGAGWEACPTGAPSFRSRCYCMVAEWGLRSPISCSSGGRSEAETTVKPCKALAGSIGLCFAKNREQLPIAPNPTCCHCEIVNR